MNNCKNAHFHQELCPCKAHPEATKWREHHETNIENMNICKNAHFHQDVCPCKAHPEAKQFGEIKKQ